MRKNVFVTGLLLLLVGVTSIAVADQRIQIGDSPNGVTLLQQDQTGLTFKVSVGSLDFLTVSTPEGTFDLMTAEGLGRPNQIGEPNLPIANKLMAIPVGSDLRVEVVSSVTEAVWLTDHGITNLLMPTKPSLSKSQDPADVPFEFDVGV
ncbi:MAG: hypothetical protein KAT58_12600, partial [candidate division Zixibacteria bacterium]|nr:hypothetical protein [candidate division Zixibacteria bacterium]